jgi:SAM-dependent methyltransferase
VGILSEAEDAFGAALLAHHRGSAVPGTDLVLERDDGWSTPAMAPAEFFKRPDEWLWWERDLLADVSGPVLDLGCGAGRHALHLQDRGLQVTGLDQSPGAAAVCRDRGLDDVRLGDLTDPPDAPDGQGWGAILLLCGNLGLPGGWDETRALLIRLAELARPGAVLVADTVDPTLTDDEQHVAYMQAMRDKGLPVGLCRLRLRYGDRATPWWNMLNLPSADIDPLVAGTPWTITHHIDEGIDQALRLRRDP